MQSADGSWIAIQTDKPSYYAGAARRRTHNTPALGASQNVNGVCASPPPPPTPPPQHPPRNAGEVLTGHVVVQLNSSRQCDKVLLKGACASGCVDGVASRRGAGGEGGGATLSDVPTRVASLLTACPPPPPPPLTPSCAVSVKESVFWDEEIGRTIAEGEGEQKRHRTVYEHKEHSGEDVLLTEVVVVSHLPHMLMPGAYKYAFQYTLAPGLPGVAKFHRETEAGDPAWRASSRKLHTRGSITYQLSAVFDVNGVFSRGASQKRGAARGARAPEHNGVERALPPSSARPRPALFAPPAPCPPRCPQTWSAGRRSS